jgi:hypothetical protein
MGLSDTPSLGGERQGDASRHSSNRRSSEEPSTPAMVPPTLDSTDRSDRADSGTDGTSITRLRLCDGWVSE